MARLTPEELAARAGIKAIYKAKAAFPKAEWRSPSDRTAIKRLKMELRPLMAVWHARKKA